MQNEAEFGAAVVRGDLAVTEGKPERAGPSLSATVLALTIASLSRMKRWLDVG